MPRLMKWLAAIAAPFMLASCILTPGKFASTLDVRADRSFTFTYVGEVQLAKTNTTGLGGELEGEDQSWDAPDDDQPARHSIAMLSGFEAPRARRWRIADEEDFSDTQDEKAKLEALAEALGKEYGFRSARYVGNRTLMIDYRISGKLDHAFVFPFHPDADVVLPFIAIELRGKDRVRIKAPGYANQQSMAATMGGLGGMPAMGADADASVTLDGTFTLTTDAEIVSQNQEEGATAAPGGGRQVVWKATPQTKEAPMAVLRLAPLP